MRRAGVTKSAAGERRGLASVETAVALPVIVFLLFGSIELANGVFLKQALSVAAYEGVRAATYPLATTAEAQARVAQVLASRNVTNYQVTITPKVDATTARGTQVKVTVSAAANTYSLGVVRLFDGETLKAEACMVRQ